MGEGTSVTIAAISDFLVGDSIGSVFDSVLESFTTITDFVISEPLLMFGLTFSAVAGVTGLVFKVVRLLGFKAHR